MAAQGMKDAPNPEALFEHVNVGDEAAGLIRGPRAKFYGPPWVNINNIGQAWSLYLTAKVGVQVDVDGHDVCNLMILLKALRSAQGYHRDSTTDTVGYALLDEILSDEAAQEQYKKDVLGL